MNPFAFLFAIAVSAVPAPLFAQEARWPLQDSAKSPTKALSVPTKLDPIGKSLTDLLNAGGRVISSYVAANGPVVTIRYQKTYVICLLAGANPATDQNVATSECYALN